MSDTLKPCPFCGGEAHIENIGWWQIDCKDCNSLGPSSNRDAYSKEATIAAWNRRQPERERTDESLYRKM